MSFSQSFYNLYLFLDPPIIHQLFYKNCSICFGFSDVYGLFGYDIGKALHMMEDILEKLESNQIKVFLENKYKSCEQFEDSLNNLKNIGSTVISLK